MSRFVLGLSLTLLTAACHPRANDELISAERTAASAGASNAAGHAGGAGGPPVERPIPPDNPRCGMGLPGPKMVEVTHPGGSFCIDSTEVTQANYQAFRDSPSSRAIEWRVECKDKKDLGPRLNPNPGTDAPPTAGVCNPEVYQPTKTPDLPVVCVDACDASAYCKWAGKRLCGKIGGGSLGQGEAESPQLSEFTYACTQGGKTAYAYGDAPDGTRCPFPLSAMHPDGITKPQVADMVPSCNGNSPPYSYINSLSGNVAEWEDGFIEKSEGGGPPMRLWNIRSNGYPCTQVGVTRHANETRGFRCCKD